jgi:hypothetical protein
LRGRRLKNAFRVGWLAATVVHIPFALVWLRWLRRLWLLKLLAHGSMGCHGHHL